MTTNDPQNTAELLERLDLSWQAFRKRVEKLTPDGMDARIDDGRTVREALAGVAFWNETCAPVFAWMRGQPPPATADWYGGADLGLGAGEPWPRDDVHHAREAAWARSVSLDEVLARLETAHARAVTAVGTLTAEEFTPGTGPGDAAGIDPDHLWAELSDNERMVRKATDCTYRLYDEYAGKFESAR